MNALDEVIQRIESYPQKDIPLRDFSKMVDIKRSTLARQARDKEILSRFDGYRHHITKQTAIEIAKKHKSAILGWVKQKDLAAKLKTTHQVFDWICKSRNLVKEQDYCGYVRFPPETVLMFKEILPQYMATDIMQYNGKTYYAVVKLAHDMASKIERDLRTARFRHEEERIYKCLYSWCKRKCIPHIKVSGLTQLYVPAHTYTSLIELVRVTDSALLIGMSRRTIYNWINQGILPTSKSPSGSTLINIKDLDNTLILRMQLDLMKKHASDPEKIDQISEYNSPFWHTMITNLRTLGGDFQREENSFQAVAKNKYLESLEGWDKIKIRAVRAVAKRRQRTDEISLDEGIGDDNSFTMAEVIEDENADNPSESLDTSDITSLVNTLPQEDCELISKLFGMGDYEATTIGNIAVEKGIPILDLQNKVDSILNSLKEKLI